MLQPDFFLVLEPDFPPPPPIPVSQLPPFPQWYGSQLPGNRSVLLFSILDKSSSLQVSVGQRHRSLGGAAEFPSTPTLSTAMKRL